MSAIFLPHLLLPFAACSGDAWGGAMKSRPADGLKNLGKLLQGMQLVETDAGLRESLSPPHERALAKDRGLAAADGLIPWAAAEAVAAGLGRPDNTGQAWAFLTPCHWAMGREHATMTDPAALELSAAASQTLLAAMQPYFETEGITLHARETGRWLAEGALFRDLPTASLDRVLGRNVDPWLPGTASAGGGSAPVPMTGGSQDAKSAAATLRRLQNEMQMLLYTHAVNDERASQRLLPVNSFWLSGTGALTQPLLASYGITLQPRTLAQAVFGDDWDAYMKAWDALDAGDIASLLERQEAGTRVRLTLCGERNAHTYETVTRGLLSRVSGLFRKQRPLDALLEL